MTDYPPVLIAEQFSHAVDLLKADLASARADQDHSRELSAWQAAAIQAAIARLEAQAQDFETRLRDLAATATQFKLLVSLAAGGGLLSLIALVKTLLGP